MWTSLIKKNVWYAAKSRSRGWSLCLNNFQLLGSLELNPIDGVTVDNKRIIIELNFSPGITVCIPQESFEFCAFQLTTSLISEQLFEKKTKWLEINAARFRALFLPLFLCHSALRMDLSLRLKTFWSSASVNLSSLLAFLCCFFKALNFDECSLFESLSGYYCRGHSPASQQHNQIALT